MLMLPIVLAAVGLASAAEFSNPIRDSGPDPFIVWDKDTSSYYLMTTTGSDLRLVSSPTIGDLHNGTDTQVYTNADMKNQTTVWAGELHKVDGAWHIYYSHKERIWAIKGGDNPLDEYADPVQLYDHFGIDNTVLVHNDTNYLLWACHSTDVSNNTIAGSSMCISHLTTPTSINKDEISVISRPTEAWEQVGGHVNEGAQPLYWDGEIYVTYSASYCTKPDYSLGLLHLIGDDPMDPAAWSKKTDGPVFSSGNGEYGPGHNGIFTSPDGTELWNVYHAVTNANGSCGVDRQTFVEKVDVSQFATKGPIFGTPAKKGVVAEGPSGEGNNTALSSSSALSATSTATRSSSASSNVSSSDSTPTISLTTSSIAASTALSLTTSLSTTESSGESPTASSSASFEEEDEASTSSYSRGGHHTTQSGGDGGIALIATGSDSASSLEASITGSSRATVTVGQGEVTSTTTLFVTAKTSQALAVEATSTSGTGGLSCKAKRARVADAASLIVI
ncbi:hypothetical protein I350_03500 [Cryptococcus amylolentus CBS 6273]|uniref:Uncharacterized protein n=1 Tax=Cryptococcus amylolentus CBS 6273 TaxID=1296118 RepID=A0A1E3K4B3_9TREE|nr:hypothetical protein I350_03500 [Cryptococcus amylolentus CBS 6273]